MAVMLESALAWELIDQFRGYLTAAEQTAAFVGLGVGEYTAVIHAVLHAVTRAGAALPPEAAARVQAWTNCYRPCQPQIPNPDGPVRMMSTQD
jgi:hypothetical protein